MYTGGYAQRPSYKQIMPILFAGKQISLSLFADWWTKALLSVFNFFMQSMPETCDIPFKPITQIKQIARENVSLVLSSALKTHHLSVHHEQGQSYVNSWRHRKTC